MGCLRVRSGHWAPEIKNGLPLYWRKLLQTKATTHGNLTITAIFTRSAGMDKRSDRNGSGVEIVCSHHELKGYFWLNMKLCLLATAIQEHKRGIPVSIVHTILTYKTDHQTEKENTLLANHTGGQIHVIPRLTTKTHLICSSKSFHSHKPKKKNLQQNHHTKSSKKLSRTNTNLAYCNDQ